VRFEIALNDRISGSSVVMESEAVASSGLNISLERAGAGEMRLGRGWDGCQIRIAGVYAVSTTVR